MGEIHRLLQRQLRRHLGVAGTPVPAALEPLVQAVSAAYEQADSDRRLLERALDLSSNELLQANSEMRTIFEALPDEFLLVDRDGTLLEFKPGAGGTSLVRGDAPVHKRLVDITSPEVAQHLTQALGSVNESGGVESLELVERADQDGPPFICDIRVLPLHDGRVVVISRDISDRKASEQRIAHLAYHDSLTGLPNRLQFQERLKTSIERAQESGRALAVMFLDVDRFKAINDTFGHGLGDELLLTIADRLRRSVRATDLVAAADRAGGSLIARLGGDEFTVILDLKDPDAPVERVCRRILEAVAEPISLNDVEVFTSVSVGVALYPTHGGDAEGLIRRADAAMYVAKQNGRNNYHVYDSAADEGGGDRVQLESALRRAGHQGQLHLVYQPLVAADSGDVTSMEVLLRWIHPDRGFISPAEFIPLAEESDLILDIGECVVHETCRQLRAWRDVGFLAPRASVNLSSRHFWRGDVVKLVEGALDAWGVPASALGIELTETAMVQNTERSAAALATLREMGIKVSLDDFGTGYSSLGYLKRFPVDLLKIDRTFIRDITTDVEDAALTKAIIAMGRSLGLQVVAEGVETGEQLSFLRKHRCDLIQGYLVCRPVGAEPLKEFVTQHRAALLVGAWPPQALAIAG